MRVALAVAALVVLLSETLGVAQGTSASQTPPADTVQSNSIAMVKADPTTVLSNTVISVVAKVRGVTPAHVKLKLDSTVPAAHLEIDLAGAKDVQEEAVELSRQLGSNVVVVLQRASDDGLVRTNWSFRNGEGRMVRTPVGTSGLGPGERRLYIWPDAQPPHAPPENLRVVGS